MVESKDIKKNGRLTMAIIRTKRVDGFSDAVF